MCGNGCDVCVEWMCDVCCEWMCDVGVCEWMCDVCVNGCVMCDKWGVVGGIKVGAI